MKTIIEYSSTVPTKYVTTNPYDDNESGHRVDTGSKRSTTVFIIVEDSERKNNYSTSSLLPRMIHVVQIWQLRNVAISTLIYVDLLFENERIQNLVLVV